MTRGSGKKKPWTVGMYGRKKLITTLSMDKSLHINSIIETSSCRSARILVSVSCLLFIAIAFVSPSDRNPRRGRRLAVTPATDRVYRLKMQVRLFHSLPDYLLPALGYSRCKKWSPYVCRLVMPYHKLRSSH